MYSLEDAKIIGITGNIGKTSTAYLLHKYLKSIGKKSVLFSSCLVDSPAGYHVPDETMDFTFSTEEQLVNVLNEALVYEAEFIILECWGESISNGIFDNIPFDLKVLTGISKAYNGHQTPEEELVTKSRFFKDEKDAKCLIDWGWILGPALKLLEDCNMSNVVLINSNRDLEFNYNEYYDNCKWITNDTKVKYPSSSIKYSINSYNGDLRVQELCVKIDNKDINLKTELGGDFHISNILRVIAILNELEIFDEETFKNFLNNKDFSIPGRFEIIEWQNRIILIDRNKLECLQTVNKLKENNMIIKLVDGYKITRSKRNELFRTTHAHFDYSYNFEVSPTNANKYADFVYITTDSIGDMDVNQLMLEYSNRVTIPYLCIPDRKQAIREAILNSKENDVICIVGRGNESRWYSDYQNLDLFKDRDIVDQVISEIDNKEETI